MEKAHKIFQALAFRREHTFAERREPVVATAGVIQMRERAALRLGDQIFVNQALESAVKGGGPEAHFAAGTVKNLLHDAVTVLLLVSEREQDMEPVGLQRQKGFRAGRLIHFDIYSE
jgi:hypothetical protein